MLREAVSDIGSHASKLNCCNCQADTQVNACLSQRRGLKDPSAVLLTSFRVYMQHRLQFPSPQSAGLPRLEVSWSVLLYEAKLTARLRQGGLANSDKWAIEVTQASPRSRPERELVSWTAENELTPDLARVGRVTDFAPRRASKHCAS